ncbi:hypothetical protein HPB50_024877 [Hyalomma asiaticum]|uniref:Uncharacterized protein n=1 Tax=Hyalomma asiaticum TaxID=266040 RepID=A0ACB7SBQ3_HYAAI|nr:hypothetical protein HPB50_024877 [Hyalomma asiaticum]
MRAGSVSWFVKAALPLAVLLAQVAQYAVCVAAEAEEGSSTEQKESRHFALAPFNLGINIPYIFNMKLLTSPTSTGLGLSVPAIFNMQLDTGGPHQLRPTGLRLNFFGRNGGNTRRGRPSIFRLAESDQLLAARSTLRTRSPVQPSSRRLCEERLYIPGNATRVHLRLFGDISSRLCSFTGYNERERRRKKPVRYHRRLCVVVENLRPLLALTES